MRQCHFGGMHLNWPIEYRSVFCLDSFGFFTGLNGAIFEIDFVLLDGGVLASYADRQ